MSEDVTGNNIQEKQVQESGDGNGVNSGNVNERYVIDYKSLNFADWENEKVTRYFRKSIINPVRSGRICEKIKRENLSDIIVWNIVFITREKLIIPDSSPTEKLFDDAIKWLTNFRSQVMQEIRKFVQSKYYEAANRDKWIALRQEYGQFDDLRDLRGRMKHESDEKVI